MSASAISVQRKLSTLGRVVCALGYLSLAALAVIAVIRGFDDAQAHGVIVGLVNTLFYLVPLIVVGLVLWKTGQRPLRGLPRLRSWHALSLFGSLFLGVWLYFSAADHASSGSWLLALLHAVPATVILLRVFQAVDRGDGRSPDPAPEQQQPGLRDALIPSDGARGLCDTEAFQARARSGAASPDSLSASR